VYNLEVGQWHNFLVGVSGVVAHNNCIDDVLLPKLKDIGKKFNANLDGIAEPNLYKCSEKAKELRAYLKKQGLENPKSIKLQLEAQNGSLPNNGVIGWDILDANGKIIKTENIAKNAYHEITLINGKVYDNININGIDEASFWNRIVPQYGYKFKKIDIFD
jgi:hypothetical protein